MAVQLQDILSKMPAHSVTGNTQRTIAQAVSATAGHYPPDAVTWVSDKNSHLLGAITNGTVICGTAASESAFNSLCTYVKVNNPRLYFAGIIRLYFAETETPSVSEKSHVHASVKLGQNVGIAPGVVIEQNCVIGDNTLVDANTVIKKGTVIGQNVRIGANNTIGGMGFGYEKNEEGEYALIPHIGNVVIEDGVEIGNNTAIDRAVLGSTIIRKNARIDNLVHIAHGVDIGENALIIANAMVAGSVTVGKNAWVAPSSSVLNKISIGENAVIGMGAVVIKNVLPGQVIVGNPGKPLQKD